MSPQLLECMSWLISVTYTFSLSRTLIGYFNAGFTQGAVVSSPNYNTRELNYACPFNIASWSFKNSIEKSLER